MHYYSHNVADYRKDTGHLTLLEHGIYRQLLDTYYLDEKPIETQLVIRRLSIKTEEEKLALKNVLADFFTPSNCGKFNIKKRCDQEIKKYHDKSKTAKANGSKGGRPKKTQSVNLANQEKSGRLANQEPLTINHKPITNVKEGDVPSPAPKAKSNKIQFKTYLKNCDDSGVDPIPEDSIVFKNADQLSLPHEFVIIAWEHFKDYWLGKPSPKSDWVQTFNNCLKNDGYSAYRKNTNGEWFLTTKGKSTEILMNSGTTQ